MATYMYICMYVQNVTIAHIQNYLAITLIITIFNFTYNTNLLLGLAVKCISATLLLS